MSPTKAQKSAAAKLEQYRRTEKDEDGGASHEERNPASDTDRLLEAITFCRTSLAAQVEEVKVDISLLRQDFQKLRDRVTTAEVRLGVVEDALPPLQVGTDRMQLQINQLFAKQDDMENRLRRCNLRFIGLPEGAEGKDPTNFLEHLLVNTYGREAFSPLLAVERAHCMPARPPPPGAPPRTFIAKLLNYKDRDVALRLAREKGNIPFGNEKIAIFPDFSAEVQRRRQGFNEAKRRLRIKHLKYSMLFPARLRIESEGRVLFFEDPEVVITWLERQEHSPRAGH